MADIEALLLPFPEAIAYLRNKIAMPTDQWDDLAGQWQDIAFTVAQVTQLRLLNDIQNLVTTQMAKGVNVDQFRGQFNDLLDQAGWSLNKQNWRAELVIQQNVRTAYAHGRWAQLNAPETKAPYWEFRHRDSVVPRPHHLALDGKIFPSDSEIWKGIFPPPFGCKCTAHPISEAEINERGLTVDTPPPLSEFADPGFGVGFADLNQHRATLINSAIDSLPAPFQALIEDEVSDFSETLDFATKKKKPKSPKCTAGKSHFCRTPTGRGSCVSAKKVCRYKPDGSAKKAADYLGKQKQYGSATELNKAAKKAKAGGKAPGQGGAGFGPDLPADHLIIAGGANITTKQLDQALRDLENEDNRKNLKKVREFITKHSLGTVIHGDGSSTDKEIENIADLVDTSTNLVKKPEAYIGGYTSVTSKHVVLTYLDTDEFNPDSESILAGVQSALAKADTPDQVWGFSNEVDLLNSTTASRTVSTYLHETGHLVHSTAGIENMLHKEPGVKALTEYSGTNGLELVAEHFVAWAIAPSQHKIADPVAHSFMNNLIDKANAADVTQSGHRKLKDMQGILDTWDD